MQMIMSAQVQNSERFLPPSSTGIVTRHKIPINIWKEVEFDRLGERSPE